MLFFMWFSFVSSEESAKYLSNACVCDKCMFVHLNYRYRWHLQLVPQQRLAEVCLSTGTTSKPSNSFH